MTGFTDIAVQVCF